MSRRIVLAHGLLMTLQQEGIKPIGHAFVGVARFGTGMEQQESQQTFNYNKK